MHPTERAPYGLVFLAIHLTRLGIALCRRRLCAALQSTVCRLWLWADMWDFQISYLWTRAWERACERSTVQQDTSLSPLGTWSLPGSELGLVRQSYVVVLCIQRFIYSALLGLSAHVSPSRNKMLVTFAALC